MATINIPTPLRPYTGGKSEAIVQGSNAYEALQSLIVSYPLVKSFLLNERGELRSYVKLYLGTEDISSTRLSDQSLNDQEVLHIIPAIAGGKA